MSAGIIVTEAETVSLLKMSDREHPLLLTWGASPVRLLPDASNDWARDALRLMWAEVYTNRGAS